jgi:dihydrofolate synthase / folylpolyglutamate synthase
MMYSSAVDYLYGLRKHGIKLGLDNTRKLLALAGNPQDKFRSIHIAGTNGKGSVSSMSASILRAYGFKTGLFTSPHLVSFTERIKVDDMEISESGVIALIEEIRDLIARADEGLNPTFFEFVTVMAFIYFARSGVEWAVVETGMGGRFDSTNTIVPEVSVITTISYDHREFLGETIQAIAAEKAGIIKAGVQAVSAPQCREAELVISRTATERSSPLSVYGREFNSRIISSGLHGSRFDYIDNLSLAGAIHDVFVPLAGGYQVVNASLAIRAVVTALKGMKAGGRAGDEAGIEEAGLIKEGIGSTRLRGRFEIISEEPLVVIDAAHNAGAAAELTQFAGKYLEGRRIILVLGIMADKDIRGVFEVLLPVASEIIFTAPSNERAETPERLAELAAQAGFGNISVTATVAEAFAEAADRQAAAEAEGISSVVLITGSFYTIGEVLAVMGERPVLGSLREAL